MAAGLCRHGAEDTYLPRRMRAASLAVIGAMVLLAARATWLAALSVRCIRIAGPVRRRICGLEYKIAASKFPSDGNGKRLTLQIEIDDIHRIIFTGSMTLMGQVERYKEQLPF